MRCIVLFIAHVALFSYVVEAGKKTHRLKAKIDGKQKPTPMIFLQDINEENNKKTNKAMDTTMENKKAANNNEPYVYVTSSTSKTVENNTRSNKGEWSKKTQSKQSSIILPVSTSPMMVSSSHVPSSPHLFILAFILSLVGLIVSFMKDDLSEHVREMKSVVYKKAFLKDLRPKNFQPVVSDEPSPMQEPDRNTLSELLPSLSSVSQIDLSLIGLPSMTSNKTVAVSQKLQTYTVPPETLDEANEMVHTMSPSSLKEGKELTNDAEKQSPGSTNPLVSSSRKMGVFFSSPFSVQANSKTRNSVQDNGGTLEVDEDEMNVTESQKSGKANPIVAVKPDSSPAATVTAKTTEFLYAIGNGMQTTANVVASAATAGAPQTPIKSYNNTNNNTNKTDNASTVTSAVNKFIDPVIFSDKKVTEKKALSQSSNHIPFTTPITDHVNDNNTQSSTSSSRSINVHTAGDSNGHGYTLTDLRDGRSLVSEGSVPGTLGGGGGETGAGKGQGQGQGGYGRGRRFFDIRNYQDSSKNDANADGVVGDAVETTTDKPKDDPTILNLWHILY